MSEFKKHSCQLLKDHSLQCKISNCGRKFYGKNSLRFHQKFAHYQRKKGGGGGGDDGGRSSDSGVVGDSGVGSDSVGGGVGWLDAVSGGGEPSSTIVQAAPPAQNSEVYATNAASLQEAVQSVDSMQYRTEFR